MLVVSRRRLIAARDELWEGPSSSAGQSQLSPHASAVAAGHSSRTRVQDTDPGLPVTPVLRSVSPAEQGPLSRGSPLESPSQRHHSPILPEAEGLKPVSTALSMLQIQSLLHLCFPALYPLPVPLKTYSGRTHGGFCTGFWVLFIPARVSCTVTAICLVVFVSHPRPRS